MELESGWADELSARVGSSWLKTSLRARAEQLEASLTPAFHFQLRPVFSARSSGLWTPVVDDPGRVPGHLVDDLAGGEAWTEKDPGRGIPGAHGGALLALQVHGQQAGRHRRALRHQGHRLRYCGQTRYFKREQLNLAECVAGVFQAAYVYTPEVYPTVLRAVGVGSCSLMARAGAILTPYVAQVGNGPTAPGLVQH